jgi:flagellar M-ring protein FliF
MLAQVHPRLPTLIGRSAAWIARRRRTVGASAGAAVVAVALVIASSRVGADVPLFDAELHPAQGVEIQNALTLWGEPFHANAQGTQVFVAASRRRDLLLRLTLAGLPHRYIPTSADVLEDQSNALTPQSVIDDRRRSGIEGDLVAGLRRIAGVSDAAVVLPPPSDGSIADDATRAPPSAAVQLVMQPGQQLSADATAGIKRFVASAYPGLAPERVTVVDGSGAVQGAALPSDRAAAKERRVQNAVQSALDAVLGAGASVVRVSIGTAGVEQQTQSTRIVPHGMLSAETGRERGSEPGKTFDKERSLRRFAYDTVSERRTTPADAQVRISVAVFLDERRVNARASSAIASLVRATAGADLHAGDEVVVDAVPFVSPTPAARSDPAKPPLASRALAPAAVAFALALFGLASLSRVGERGAPIRSSMHAARPAHVPLASEAEAMLESLAMESPQTAAYVLAGLAPGAREEVLRGCDTGRRAAIESFMELQRGNG